jgi:thiol:disulfide interchange protein DsbC
MKLNAIRSGLAAALMALGLAAGAPSQAQAPTAGANTPVPAAMESALRKNLSERLNGLGAIDEVRRAPLPGLFEVRVGSDLFYTDAEGNYLVQGEIYDTRARRNLTEERIEKLLAVDFSKLPVKDAFVTVRGDGKRKLAVFADPNCGYCKRFERDLQGVDNVTVYTYLYPILGPDSNDKSRNIWCSRDKGKTWLDWMIRNQSAARAAASCDTTALVRNVEFGKRHKITGTPTLIFADGSRVPGAIGAAELEKLLANGGK